MTVRRPRVAVVAASPRIVGGHSVQAEALAAHLRREGVDLDLVPIDVVLPSWLSWVRGVRGLRTVVNEALYVASLRRLAGVQVVHAFSASYWSFLLAPVPAMLAGRLFRAHVVLHYHSGEVADHLDRWGAAVHPWLRLADEIVVCSRFQQKVFERHGHQARVVANVIEPAAFNWRQRDPLRPRFVCTRNFETHYGVDVVIEAFALIRAVRPEATLELAGTGTCEPALRALAGRLGTRGIAFLGVVAPAAMPALLDCADIYLNASTIDNQPVSLIEAGASGLPIVSTPAGAIPEFVRDGHSGVLVRHADPRHMAEAALAMLDRPAWAHELARQARRDGERFNWATVRQAWSEVYRMPFGLPVSTETAPLSTPVHVGGGGV